MKRNITSLLALAALVQAPLFAQKDATSDQGQLVEQMRRSLVQSDQELESLHAELVRVRQQVAKEDAMYKQRLMQAIEEELKAKLAAESLDIRYLKLTRANDDLKKIAFSDKQVYAEKEFLLKRRTAELQLDLESAQQMGSRKESDLKTAIYVSRYVEGRVLADIASQTFGHLVTYTEAGTAVSKGRVSSRQRFTSVPTGNQILVTDYPDQLSKALDLLIEIDASCNGNELKGLATSSQIVVVYTPKIWTFDQVYALIVSDTNRGRSKLSVSEIPGSQKVRIEGPQAKVTQALQLLQDTDTFPPQVRLRAWLIHTNGSTQHTGVALPKKLVSGLEGALPGQKFFGLASMLIQTSVGHKKQVSAVTLVPNTSADFLIREWTFTTALKSYDSDGGLLALEQCSFNVEFIGNTERLSADLLLRKDEFTVVGSIQGGSMYLVLTYEEV